MRERDSEIEESEKKKESRGGREKERERDKGGEGGKENAQVATNGCCVHAEVQRRGASMPMFNLTKLCAGFGHGDC